MADPLVMRIAILWRDGRDTAEIAEHLGIAEAEVWNRMDAAKALLRRRAA